MTTPDLAAALLKDVPRYDHYEDGYVGTFKGRWMQAEEVLAALTAALDPAIAEQAGEVVERLQKAGQKRDGFDCVMLASPAADLITALLTANTALRAERDTVLGMYMRSSDEGFRQKARAEAADLAEAGKVGWQPIETAPKDKLIDIWLSEGKRWCDCYYDSICEEWRTSRPSGKLVWVKAQHVTHWMLPPADPERVPALLARIAAMEAQIKGLRQAVQHANDHANAAIEDMKAAEAERDALRAERDAWQASQHYSYIGKDGKPVLARDLEARAEAAEAKVEKLRGALQIARVHVANNAEGWSVSRGAARDDLTIVDAALTTEEPK